MNTYDIDGVIDLGKFIGVFPGPTDIIITGRSYEEKEKTFEMLHSRGIFNLVIFNPLKFRDKTRKTSGIYKGNMIVQLKKTFEHGVHFEDDPVQIEEILKIDKTIRIVYVESNLTVK